MKIRNIKALRAYIVRNSNFSEKIVNNAINALGFPLIGSGGTFNELSTQFENCAEHGANIGMLGFMYYSETVAFFMQNRNDIVSHMEQTARERGIDIISMVQGFGVFQNSEKPTQSEVGRALWDSGKEYHSLASLYNVFAWYALEEVSRTWLMYLEENPGYKAELSA
jgi:hypothetical protein